MSVPVWSIDGSAFPRNPDSYEIKWDKANVTYEHQADGSQLRVQAPKLVTSADLTMTWKNANRKLIRFFSRFMNQAYPLPGAAHHITVAGIVPALQIYAWLDTPQIKMSQDVYTQKYGEGGTLQDFQIVCRIDGRGFRSLNPVPAASTTTAAQVAAWFGGPVGTAWDEIPQWNGTQWQTALTSSSNSVTVPNLGTQDWYPMLRLNGPFSTMTITELYADVDGTGQGVEFTWTGSPVTNGQYILFDLAKMRCWLVIGGTSTEVYTFSVTTVSDGQPFGYWPGMPPGNNSWNFGAASNTASTIADFSNNGAEVFAYWG